MWALLGRSRIAEDGRTLLVHVSLVRDDQDEIDDGHEGDEVDDGGDERAHVDGLAVEDPTEPTGRGLPGDGVDQGRDDVVSESLDQSAEGQCHDQADGDDDQVALHEEILEALEHGQLLAEPPGRLVC